MRIRLALPGLILGLTAAALVVPTTAEAGLDIDFGATVTLGDRDNVFFHISGRYFDREPEVVQRWHTRYRNPDDLAVALYISRRSGATLDAIYRLRRDGRSWWEVGLRFGMPVDAWFVEVRRDPGPPYGKAYGHWKKHRHDRKAVVVLGDSDVRNLVAVRMIHEYYGVPVEVAMDWRSDGRKLRDVLADEYHRRHGKSASQAKAHKGGPGHGKGHGKKK